MFTRAALVCLSITIATSLNAQDGAAIYHKHCAGCHDSGAARVPGREALRRLSPERILTSLEGGTMMMMGARRSAAERRAVAEFLAAKPFGREPLDAPPRQAFCRETSVEFTDPLAGPHWNGWGTGRMWSRR